MNELVDAFLNYLSVERGLSRNTIISYQEDINAYIDFLKAEHIDSFSLTRKNDITDFMLFQNQNSQKLMAVFR